MQNQQQTMIHNNVKKIIQQIETLTLQTKFVHKVKLIAVSKTKTVQEILAAYHAGVRNFGQNYVDEIQTKQLQLPLDINWHFIGHLQSNKIKKVMVSNLDCLETVDRESLAEKIQKYVQKNEPQRILNVLLQVKTSEEQTKHGAETQQVPKLFQYIRENCKNLHCKGLMTIGKQGDTSAFVKLAELKAQICQQYDLPTDDFELSMGMSADFQTAIEYGATSVRIGSSIFGPRSYPRKQ